MFKVLCVKTGTYTPDAEKIIEGAIYTVVGEDKCETYDGRLRYDLAETPNSLHPVEFFIPISSIDETEMERNYKTEKV